MPAATRTVEAVWRIESARLIGALARTVHDLGRAEDLAQDALVAALEQWPKSGVPDNPGAWLMTVAKRRAVDQVRREVTLERKLDVMGRDLPTGIDPVAELELELHVTDDVLRLMFAACHPVLTPEARVALTLRMVAGLTTEEIARAYVVQTTAMAARITRAKKALSAAGVPFEVPVGDELTARLPSVLETVYLLFNEGYSATAGVAWTRPELCAEAMRLGRMLVGLVPGAEVLGLAALMEIQASRLRARVDAAGQPVTLLEQDRGRWDRLLITHALDYLDRAGVEPGPYLLQARIAACHARAPQRRGHRLGRDRPPVRRVGRSHPLADRRAEPGGRGGDGRRTTSGAGDRRHARRRPGVARLLPAAERARRPACQARPR